VSHDRDAAVALWIAAGLTREWNPPDVDFDRAVTGPSSAVLGGFFGGHLVATVMVGHDGHRGWVYYLAVDVTRRGRGDGRALMQAAETWVRERGITKIQLMVRTSNESVLGFYDALGYGAEDTVVRSRWLDASPSAASISPAPGMSASNFVDRKPPRLCGNERDTLLALLTYQRESLIGKLEGLSDDAARGSIVASGTSLLWLVTHLTRAQAVWVLVRFAGMTDDENVTTTDDGDTVDSAIRAYRLMSARVDEVIMASDLDALTVDSGDETPVSLRWIVAHLLEETARHAGHADILREVIDGATGR